MSNTRSNTRKPTPQSTKQVYQIRLEGQLDDGWTDWFEGVCVKENEDSNTLLTCTVSDQPELFGLLRKVRDLGVPLLSVTRVQPDQNA
jgi:hypothetical protein